MSQRDRGQRMLRSSRKPRVEDVFAAVESLYADEIKPFGWLVRKRCVERSQAVTKADVGIDFDALRKVCKDCPSSEVLSNGGKWFVLLVGRAHKFIDFTSHEDVYPPELWEALTLFLADARNSGNGKRLAIPHSSGSYSIARSLYLLRPAFLRGRSLGEVCHIVQLAVQRQLLPDDRRIPSSLRHPRQLASSQAPSLKAMVFNGHASQAGVLRAGSLTVSTIELLDKNRIPVRNGLPLQVRAPDHADEMPQLCGCESAEVHLGMAPDATEIGSLQPAFEARRRRGLDWMPLCTVRNTFLHVVERHSLDLCATQSQIGRSRSVPKHMGSLREQVAVSGISPKHTTLSPLLKGVSAIQARTRDDVSTASTCSVCRTSSPCSLRTRTPSPGVFDQQTEPSTPTSSRGRSPRTIPCSPCSSMGLVAAGCSTVEGTIALAPNLCKQREVEAWDVSTCSGARVRTPSPQIYDWMPSRVETCCWQACDPCCLWPGGNPHEVDGFGAHLRALATPCGKAEPREAVFLEPSSGQQRLVELRAEGQAYMARLQGRQRQAQSSNGGRHIVMPPFLL